MLIRLIEALPEHGAVAMLCKTMTARKVLKYFWKIDDGREVSIFRIDSKASFDVSVDACLFIVSGKFSQHKVATVYEDLSLSSNSFQFGFIDGALVSDVDLYRRYRHLDGETSAYRWRSGIKHDASKIMEFTRHGPYFENGLGESIELEDDYMYRLLKSSDIGNGRIDPRKWVLQTGEETSSISETAPKTWSYLNRHAQVLDNRRSSIYRNRPKFSIFGIGEYSFAPWKVAISGLYKSLSFVVVPPVKDRPVMLDDTCYSIPCSTEAEATLLCELLSSEPAVDFLRSLVFMDSKKPITVEILKRISFISIARTLGKLQSYSGVTQEG